MELYDLIYAAPEKSPDTELQGAFAKSVLVLFAAEPTFSEPNKAFLSKILQAVSLHLENDTLYGEINREELWAISTFARDKGVATALIFGLGKQNLGINAAILPYQPTIFYGVNWLFADSLSEIEADKNKKALLWQALKSIF